MSDTATHYSVEELLSLCGDGEFTYNGGSGDCESCSADNGERVALEGEFYFSEVDRVNDQPGAPLFPRGSKTPSNDNDHRWLDEDLLDAVDIRISEYPVKQRQALFALHGRVVNVIAATSSSCATGHVDIVRRYDPNSEIITWMSGYCHSQADIYLNDPIIRVLEETDPAP